MNRTKQQTRFSKLLIATLLLSGVTLSSAQAANRWQEQQLHQPSESQLAREQGGAVTIYSGFTDKQVLAVLDQQFDRIEHMMFIRTVVTDSDGKAVIDEETGKPLTEDEDC